MQADLSPVATYCPEPGFVSCQPNRETAAQAQGRRYEEKALLFLNAWALSNGYILKPKPWIEYRNLFGQTKYCQPDALLFSATDDNLLLIEVKLRHTRDAFKQLRLYKELIASMHPEFAISPIEICRYYDPEEYKSEVFMEVRPHDLPHATVIWEPREWIKATN